MALGYNSALVEKGKLIRSEVRRMEHFVDAWLAHNVEVRQGQYTVAFSEALVNELEFGFDNEQFRSELVGAYLNMGWEIAEIQTNVTGWYMKLEAFM